MHRFDLLIFDLDGVLANTSPCHSRAYSDLWRELGIKGPAYELIAGRRTRDVVMEFTAALKLSEAQVGAWTRYKQRQARAYFATETIVYSDSASCLEAVAERGVHMALGTAASRESTYLILEHLGVIDFFSIIITADDVRQGKPSPEVYLKVMAEAGGKPCRTLIIEDSPSGLEAAIASKAYVVSVRTGTRIDDPRFVGSFSDLHALLGSLGIARS